jgi:hypothetical protein
MWVPAVAAAGVIAWAAWQMPTRSSAIERGWVLLAVVGVGAVAAAWASRVYSERCPTSVAVRTVGVFAWAVSVLAYRSFDVGGLWASLYAWGPIVYFGLVRADKFLTDSEAGVHESQRLDSAILAGVAVLLAFMGRGVMPDASLVLVLTVGFINLVGVLLPSVTISLSPEAAGENPST